MSGLLLLQPEVAVLKERLFIGGIVATTIGMLAAVVGGAAMVVTANAHGGWTVMAGGLCFVGGIGLCLLLGMMTPAEMLAADLSRRWRARSLKHRTNPPPE